MTATYFRFLTRHRLAVVLLALLIVGAFATGLGKLRLSSNLEVFFPPGDPQLAAYDAVRNTYTRDDNLFLVFVPATDTLYTRENLAILEEITAAAWQIPYAIRVDSLSNFQHTEADGDDLQVRPLVDGAATMSDSDLQRVVDVAHSEPALLGWLTTVDGDFTAINVTMELPPETRAQAIPEAVAHARALRRDIESRHPGAQLLITGKVAGNNAFTEAAVYDMTHIVPLALLVALACIAGFLLWASGSVLTALAATAATILIIAMSVLIAMGAAGWLGFAVTPPMANAPTVVLTLAVADCMHLLMSYFQARGRGLDRESAAGASLNLNFQPVMLTSVTTVIGFLALNFSDAPPFHDLGNTVAIGIIAAWLLSISVLPVLMLMLPGDVHRHAEDGGDRMTRLADLVLARPRRTLALSSLLIVAAMAGLPQNRLYDVWAEYFDESTQIRRDADFSRQKLNGFNTLEFSLSAGEPGGIADPGYLANLEAFTNWLVAQPEVARVASFSNVMKRLNRNMHGDDPAWYRLPDQRELAAQYLLLYEFSLPFGLDLTNQINLDKSATRLTAGLNSSSTADVLSLQQRAGAWLQANTPPAFAHPGASSDAMFAHIGRRNVISMLLGSTLGLCAISLIIALALRSLRFGVLSLLLNLLPMLVGFGVWGMLVGRIGLGLSVVSGLTMGIVVDFTVHLLSKYKLGQESRGLSTPDAIRFAWSTVGVALTVTTAVLFVNFGLLALSVFALNAEMGVLTAGIILAALAIDLTFLPALLVLLDRRRARPAAAGPALLARG